MGLIVKPFTFSAGATIIAAEHNSDFDTVYNLVNGQLSNSNIVSGAAIDYSKLSLALAVTNADIAAAAGIVASKLDLTSPGAIGSTNKNTGAFSVFNLGTTRQGDFLYDNGTSFVRLLAGTSGKFLMTNGTGANPAWSTVLQRGMMSSSVTMAISGTPNYSTFGASLRSATEGSVSMKVPYAGTAKNLYVSLDTAMGSNTCVITVQKNASDTALVVSIADPATTGSNVSDTVAFAAGDILDWYITSGASATKIVNVSMEYD